MSGVNKVILVGNLGTAPEVKKLQSGDSVANFSVATSETWNDKNGEKQVRTEWHKVSIFGKGADIASKILTKGAKVFIEGKLRTRKWEDKNGNNQYTTEIIVNGLNGSFQLLDKLQNNESSQNNNQQIESSIDDDFGDIPF